MALLHDTIRPSGACRFTCTSVNRKVWHVTRMYRTGENREKRNYSLFYYRADSVALAVGLPNQSAVHLKRPSPYNITEARRVACMNAPKCAHAASKHFHILHGILMLNQYKCISRFLAAIMSRPLYSQSAKILTLIIICKYYELLSKYCYMSVFCA